MIYIMSKMSKSEVRRDGKNVYYSVSITHNDVQSVNGYPTEAFFNESRSEAIIERAADYKLSVTRFRIPGSVIPIQIVSVQKNLTTPTDNNQTIYSITLTKGSRVTQVFLEFIPKDQTVYAPPPGYISSLNPIPPVIVDYYSYYSLYDYQTFCDMMNKAFSIAFGTLTGILSTQPPIIVFDSTTQLFTIYVQQSYIIDTINIYFNYHVYNLFNNTLNMNLLGYSTSNGLDAQLIIENTYNNIVNGPPFDTGNNYYTFTQQFSNVNTEQWQSPIQLVITSNLQTINQLQPNIPTNSSILVQSQNNFKPVLTDFNIVGVNYREGLTYNPTAQYRYLTLIGNNPIISVQMQLYWVDNYQNYFPIFLAAHDVANLLLLFEKI